MKKETKIILAIFIGLAAIVAVLGYVNRNNIIARQELLADGYSFLVTHGAITHAIHISELINLGAVPVTASPRGEDRHFTGVLIRDILNYLSFDYATSRSIAFTSHDGFNSAIDIDELSHAFVVFEEDGERLASRDEGGPGLFMIVMAEDPFPNRWARYLLEITVQ